MPAHGTLRSVLRALHGRHSGARADPLRFQKAVKAVNEVLGSLRMEKHPDKTFIGRIERGFDFLGYHFGPQGLALAEKTLAAFVERALRLYEQDLEKPSGSSRFGTYVRRWAGWATWGLTATTLQDIPTVPGTASR